MQKKIKKEYEILTDFANIENAEERIDLLKQNCVTFYENQNYTTVLPDDERENLELLEKESYEEAQEIKEQIKKLSKKRRELMKLHDNSHDILSKNEIEENGTIFVLEDNENNMQELRVTEKGVVLSRQKKQNHQLVVKFNKAM